MFTSSVEACPSSGSLAAIFEVDNKGIIVVVTASGPKIYQALFYSWVTARGKSRGLVVWYPFNAVLEKLMSGEALVPLQLQLRLEITASLPLPHHSTRSHGTSR